MADDKNEAKTYKVTATKNLGKTITGRGGRIPAGRKGEVTLTKDRYDRLKKAGYFE